MSSVSANASLDRFRAKQREEAERKRYFQEALNDEWRPDQVVPERLPTQTPDIEPRPKVKRGYEHRKRRLRKR